MLQFWLPLIEATRKGLSNTTWPPYGTRNIEKHMKNSRKMQKMAFLAALSRISPKKNLKTSGLGNNFLCATPSFLFARSQPVSEVVFKICLWKICWTALLYVFAPQAISLMGPLILRPHRSLAVFLSVVFFSAFVFVSPSFFSHLRPLSLPRGGPPGGGRRQALEAGLGQSERALPLQLSPPPADQYFSTEQ